MHTGNMCAGKSYLWNYRHKRPSVAILTSILFPLILQDAQHKCYGIGLLHVYKSMIRTLYDDTRRKDS